ncbi:MAG: hypothetical protein HZA50_07840, partial [Planctomycetes bacterium]|nr:hypothetical protein [Planctomycetota bacterium]
MAVKVAKKRRIARVAGWSAGILAVLVILAGAIVKYWYAPSVIRRHAALAVERYWEGSVRIGSVDFNYFGPATLRDVELLDSSGRQWVRLGAICFDLRDWPGTHPILEQVRIEGLDITACRQDGKYGPPVKAFPKGPSRLKDYMDLRRITVDGFSASIVDYAGGQRRLIPLGQAVNAQIDIRSDGAFDLSVPDFRLATIIPLKISELQARNARIKDGKIEAPAVSFRTCGGEVRAGFYSVTGGPGRIVYGGKAAAESIDLPELVCSI